jgi:hypothetical protein
VAGPTAVNAFAWYKADAGTSSVVDNTALSQWDDQSGNARHLTQGTGGLQPTYQTNELNGLPVVRFDGGDGLSATFTTLAQPGTVFLVARNSNPASSTFTMFIDAADVGATNRWVIGTSGTGADWQFYAGTAVQTGTPDTDYHLFTAVFDGASSYGRLDRVALFTSGLGSMSLGSGLRVGYNYNASGDFIVGDIAELVVYDSALSSGDRDDVESALTAKWLADGPSLQVVRSPARFA